MSLSETNNPLISVIINCYNGEKFLKKSIESVINQTYSNWEIIFWDNLSNDNSKKIVNHYTDKRIKYFGAKNFTKLYEARNLAIEKASGEYIAFLDVDDWWTNNKLEIQINKIKYEKLNVVYSNFYRFYERSKRKKIFATTNLPTGLITQSLLNLYGVGILTVLIKKDILKNRKFNKNYEIIGDFDLIIDISQNLQFGCIQEPLAYYRIHTDNLSLKKIEKEKNELETWIKEKKNELKSYSVDVFDDKIQVLRIKMDLFSGKRSSAMKKIFLLNNNFRKLKFLISLILPIKILKILIS